MAHTTLLSLQECPVHLPTYQLDAPGVPLHQQPVDIIICVHNALNDLELCLNSISQYTSSPYHLIIIDDGSAVETEGYLRDYANAYPIELIRNQQATGYTRAANLGLSLAKNPFVVLLNSDTIVSPYWLDRLIACAQSDKNIGMVGPLSNTASWQSIPHISANGDWATNDLPVDMTVLQMAARVAAFSSRLYPRLPFLNGFCLLIKRELIENIGYFDEEIFAEGYGEENDYCLRARQAGWELAIADDTYIYHSQSKSYSHERRKRLAEQAHHALIKKHGQLTIEQGVTVCQHNRVLQALRFRAQLLIERWNIISQAHYHWRGKRIIFVLPIMEPGGGANVVIFEARALRRMGIDACILNFLHHKEGFEKAYPELDVPVIYTPTDFDIPKYCQGFDAVIATANNSVEWIAPLVEQPNPPVIAYYIQDFEPYFHVNIPSHYRLFWRSPWIRRRFASYYFRKKSDFRQAWISYLRIPQMIHFTKTVWNKKEVEKQTGKSCTVVGASCNIDLFIPRIERSLQGRIRICAMIRPSSSRRGARRTMEVLQEIYQRYQDRVDIILFGVKEDDPEFLALPRNFSYNNKELLTSEAIALLFSQVDIFVDFSNFQAMGLTAIEAMACGVAVILPDVGGSNSFAIHGKNALMVNTHSFRMCYKTLETLIENQSLRQSLADQAYRDMVYFYPESAAYRILKLLFPLQ